MGWRRDKDHWLKRPTRADDAASIKGADTHAFTCEGFTYCRSMGQAEAIDRGERLTRKQADRLAQDRHGSEFNPETPTHGR